MSDFVFEKTDIDGLMVITPKYSEDNRGYFLKAFEKKEFQKRGLPTTFSEDLESSSRKGTLRGIHFQSEYPQGKLVRVIRGSVFDVAVDLRIDSSTYGKWRGFELTESNHKMLYIPERFGHGFLALEDNTIMSYKCTDIYSAKYEDGIMWNDSDIAIEWPTDRVGSLVLSERDKHYQSFKEYSMREK